MNWFLVVATASPYPTLPYPTLASQTTQVWSLQHPTLHPPLHGCPQSDGTDHQHDSSVTSVGVTIEEPLDGEKLNAWLSKLLRTQGADLFRSKGVLNIAGSPYRCAGSFVHCNWLRITQLRNQARLQTYSLIVLGVRVCKDTVLHKSVEVCCQPSPSPLVTTRRHVFQGVHMLLTFGSSGEDEEELNAPPPRDWLPDEPKHSRVVFIGRNLDREALTSGLRKCIA